MGKINKLDLKYYNIIRNEVSSFIKKASLTYDLKKYKILDIAPQNHKGVKEFFQKSKVYTLDIDPLSKCNYIGDICKQNKQIQTNSFDIIFCTEVLEHVENPFKASKELQRILKPKGKLFITTPFNFRIHNPLPDNWRFTIHGLRELFKNMKILEIEEVKSERFLMPIQYKLIIEKL